jgi:hypothetical protein
MPWRRVLLFLGAAYLLEVTFLLDADFLAAVALLAVFLPPVCFAAKVAELGSKTPAAATRMTERMEDVLMCMALIDCALIVAEP